jgi:hypothetical protein
VDDRSTIRRDTWTTGERYDKEYHERCTEEKDARGRPDCCSTITRDVPYHAKYDEEQSSEIVRTIMQRNDTRHETATMFYVVLVVVVERTYRKRVR